MDDVIDFLRVGSALMPNDERENPQLVLRRLSPDDAATVLHALLKLHPALSNDAVIVGETVEWDGSGPRVRI